MLCLGYSKIIQLSFWVPKLGFRLRDMKLTIGRIDNPEKLKY